MPTEAEEAEQLIEDRLEALQTMTWDQLAAYGERKEEAVTASGRRFEVHSQAFWDMEEWKSGLNIEVKVRPERGWRRWWRYKGWAERGAPEDRVPDPPPDWAPYRKRNRSDEPSPEPDRLDQLRREFDAYRASRFPTVTSASDRAADAHAELAEFDAHVAGLLSHIVGRSPLPTGTRLEPDPRLRGSLEQLADDERPDVARDGKSLLWTYNRLEQLVRLGQRVLNG